MRLSLSIKNLTIFYDEKEVVKNFSMEVEKGKVYMIIGESGSGKSTIIKAIFGILPSNAYVSDKSKIILKIDGEKDLLKISEEERRLLRWKAFSIVLQAAQNSLNPLLKIKEQLIDSLLDHKIHFSDSDIYEVLEMVGLDKKILNFYPSQLSGGMRQRVLIAMALICKPAIILLDEPTSALDVFTQHCIINNLKRLKENLNFSMIFVTHDISLVPVIGDYVFVLKDGMIVEEGNAKDVFFSPSSEYTKMLIKSAGYG